MSEAFIRTDFRCRSSVCKSLSHTCSTGSSPRLDSCCQSSDPYRLRYESASFVWFSINHLGVRPVYHIILIANMICDCRFVADTLSCLQWESCDRLGERQGDWSRIRQSWQTHNGGDMDQKTDNMNRDEGSYQLSTYGTSFYILTTGTGNQSWWRLPTWSWNVDK